MTKDEKIKILSHCFEEVIWMAIRYADGRHTYAPGMVRDAIKSFKKVNPDWNPREDKTLEKPSEDELGGISFYSDYLWDLVQPKE